MRPNASQLSMRDPALAAVMGALPGSDFGYAPRGYGRGPAYPQVDRQRIPRNVIVSWLQSNW